MSLPALLRQFLHLVNNCLMSFLFVSGSVFKTEGEEGPEKPLVKPVPNHCWLFSEFFTPSA